MEMTLVGRVMMGADEGVVDLARTNGMGIAGSGGRVGDDGGDTSAVGGA